MGCVDIVVLDRRQNLWSGWKICCGPFGRRFVEGI